MGHSRGRRITRLKEKQTNITRYIKKIASWGSAAPKSNIKIRIN